MPQRQVERLTATLEGPVTVTYHKENGVCVATALQFDLIGIGLTKPKAFRELAELVNTYLIEAVNATGPVEFFHPSDTTEWNRADKEYYIVTFELAIPLSTRNRPPRRVRTIGSLYPYRNNIESSHLAPVGA